MEWVEFWGLTDRPEVAWQTLSAMSTFFAVVVAIALPTWQSHTRKVNYSRRIVAELFRNREALSSLAMVSHIRKEHGRSGQMSSQRFFLDTTLRNISFST